MIKYLYQCSNTLLFTQSREGNPNAINACDYISEIFGYKKQGGDHMVKYRMTDEEEEFEDIVEWVKLPHLWVDCVPEDEEEENLVIAYAKELHQDKKLTEGFAQEVAKLAKKNVKELFPGLLAPSEDGATNKSPVVQAELCKCQMEHKVGADFTDGMLEKIENKHYFVNGRKYEQKACNLQGETCDGPVLKPSAKSPCYVCKQFHLDKVSDCDFIYCTPCHAFLLKNAHQKKAGRRSFSSRVVAVAV